MSDMGKYCEIWNVLVNLQSEIYYLSYLLLACVAFFLFVYVGLNLEQEEITNLISQALCICLFPLLPNVVLVVLYHKKALCSAFIGWTITFKFRDQPNLSGAES